MIYFISGRKWKKDTEILLIYIYLEIRKKFGFRNASSHPSVITQQTHIHTNTNKPSRVSM